MLRARPVYIRVGPGYSEDVDPSGALRVLHVVDAMGGSEHLWGKERVVGLLMHEQRRSGAVEPHVATFADGTLAAALAAEGFPVTVLGTGRLPAGALRNVARMVRRDGIQVVHSHGYKANVLMRLLRVTGALPGVRLVSTCHGWVDSTAALRAYNALDRRSAFLSDITTVPDPAMLAAFPAFSRTRHVANGIPELEDAPAIAPDADVRAGATFVAGTLGRISVEKGIPDFLAAAATCPDPEVTFTVAGAGNLSARVAAAGDNVRYAGYFARPDTYLHQLDVYVQASHHEGLSLALLEAMRAGKPIVATDVGATRAAVVDRESGLLVPAQRPDRLLDAVLAIKRDLSLGRRLGAGARRRFLNEFQLQTQHDRFLTIYAGRATE
jgi:glycosyltransferase involved in cell wall biosynthesis